MFSGQFYEKWMSVGERNIKLLLEAVTWMATLETGTPIIAIEIVMCIMHCRKYHLHDCNRDSHLHNFNKNCHPHICCRNFHLHKCCRNFQLYNCNRNSCLHNCNKKIHQHKIKKIKALCSLFLRMGLNCLKAGATLRRQFTFYR